MRIKPRQEPATVTKERETVDTSYGRALELTKKQQEVDQEALEDDPNRARERERERGWLMRLSLLIHIFFFLARGVTAATDLNFQL